MSRRFQGNLFAVVLAFFLSIALYAGITNYGNLATDIRSVAGVNNATITTDILMTIDDGSIVIVTGKDIPAVESVSMLFVYDNQTVRWTDSTLTSEYETAIAQGDQGQATVIITTGPKTLIQGTEIARVRVTGSVYDIVVSDIVATFEDGSAEPLSITLP